MEGEKRVKLRKNNGAAPVTGEDGLKVIRIIEAAFESSKQKRVVELVEE